MKKYNIRKKLLSENGGAAVLVVFTIFAFLIVGMGAFMSVSTLRKSQLNSNLRIQQIYGEDYEKVDGVYEELLTKYAKYDEPYIPVGFTHIEGTWNNGYTIKETATGNEFVWVPCVTDQRKVKDGDTVVTFERVLPETTEETDEKYRYNRWNLIIKGEIEPANEIRKSVGKHGGFYIAKYEAGIEGTIENYALETKTKTDGSVKPLSKLGCGVWNYISRTDALTVAASMVNTSDGVKSGLISGEAWDTTLQWMVNASDNKDNQPNKGYDIDSTDKGWYNNVSNNKRNVTGYELSKVNNIYDMAGNVWEWTTENCENDGIVIRGGAFDYSGYYPAASRSNYYDVAYSDYGFRVVLYKDV